MELSDVWTKSLLPTTLDYFIIFFYLTIILFIGIIIRSKYISKYPEYKFFLGGLFTKIIFGIIFCLIYVLYYNLSGDTVSYYNSSEALLNLFNKDPYTYFSILFGNQSSENFSYFDITTSYPDYYTDKQAFAVVRFINPLVIISLRSYFTTTILLAALSYIGIWKLYLMFCEFYPNHNKLFAVTVLFLPSVLFWGSGILKDTFTLSASCWYTYNFYKIFIKKKDIYINLLLIIVNIYIILSLKPYIIVALFPGTIIWGFYAKIKSIKNKILKFATAPVIVIIAFLIANLILGLFKSKLGTYSDLDSIIRKAQITQQDLIRGEQYGSNYFNIGEFNTKADIIKKTPQAVVAGLYRPFIWEAANVLMLISGLENLLLLILTLYIFLWSAGIVRSLKNIMQDPLLIFVFLFSIFFAFSVGLTTANFGALVRYKIPLMPLFTSGLVILFIKKQKLSEFLKI